MPKALCISGLSIAAVLFVLFAWDLVSFFSPAWAPFKGASKLMDMTFILCSVGLAYISWITWKEQV
jgi:hypothetical protein